MNSTGVPGGVAGIVANSPNVAAVAGATGSGNSSTRSSETVNYEISKVVSHHVLPTGKIEKLSIAVLIDGKPIAAPTSEDAEGIGEPTEQASFTPWTSEDYPFDNPPLHDDETDVICTTAEGERLVPNGRYRYVLYFLPSDPRQTATGLTQWCVARSDPFELRWSNPFGSVPNETYPPCEGDPP